MRVYGFTDEITVCDCCGKKNLSGTFTIETDAGELLHYGSVCVNKVYGKKRGEQIKSEAKYIAAVRNLPWSTLIDRYSRGFFPNYIGAYIAGRYAGDNRKSTMDAVTEFRHWSTKEVLRERAA